MHHRLTMIALTLGGLAASTMTTGCSTPRTAQPAASTPPPAVIGDPAMRLGAFSVSLAVKDLAASRAFYEKLGFRQFGGNGKNYLIMKNETTIIGLFQGMFKDNILTFNPGWDHACATLPQFNDVRELQAKLEAQGVTLATRADPASDGPASFVVVDPDGNQILIDQHVPKPGAKAK